MCLNCNVEFFSKFSILTTPIESDTAIFSFLMSKTNTSGIGNKLNMSLTSTFCEKVETEIKKIIILIKYFM